MASDMPLNVETLAAQGHLPACPAVLAGLIRATQNPETTTAELAEILSSDQNLTVKVLRLVNSAFYGLPRSVRSVEEAAFRLGFRELWALAVAVKVDDMYRLAETHWSPAAESLWHHSLKTGVIARLLAKRLPGMRVEELFTAGVLHDIGKLALCGVNGEKFAEISRRGEVCGPRLCKAEQEVWGMDHAALGGALMRRWQLPEVLAASVAAHHALNLQDGAEGRFAALLSAADALAHAAKVSDQATLAEEPALRELAPAAEEEQKEEPIFHADFSDGLLSPEVSALFRLDGGECVGVITEAMRMFKEMVALFQ